MVKYHRFLIISVIFFSIITVSCSDKKTIKILTNDLLLLETRAQFINSSNITVVIDYVDVPCIYRFYYDRGFYDYDIIAGYKNYFTPFESNLKEIDRNDYVVTSENKYIKAFEEYSLKNSVSILYGIDTPVFIEYLRTGNNSIFTEKSLSYNEFHFKVMEFSKKLYEDYYEYAYIPAATSFSFLEFLYILAVKPLKIDNKLRVDFFQAQNLPNYYFNPYNIDQSRLSLYENTSILTSQKRATEYSGTALHFNIDSLSSNFKIQSIEKRQIYIQDNPYIGGRIKLLSIIDNKNQYINNYISYILSPNVQEIMSNASLNYSIHDKVHLPVTDSSYKIFQNDDLYNYISNLSADNYEDTNLHNKIVEAYNLTVEQYNNSLFPESGFLSNFETNLNK